MKIRMAHPEFEGAGYGRRLASWGMSGAGPNNTLFSSLGTLRARARELVRNDPQISGAVDSLASNLVGVGISPLWKIDDFKTKRQIQELWADWVLEADADQMLDFYGLQTLICRAVLVDGECLVRVIHREPQAALTVPLQLQVIEADHLDQSYNTIAPNGNEIRMGIEFDRIGQRAAYWLFREHPGEMFSTIRDQYERVRIPASEIMHITQPKRAGQKRGLPLLANVIVTAHELNQFDDAELVRKKTAAMFGGFLKQPPEDAEMPSVLGNLGGQDESGSPVIDMEPGTFPALPPGYDVTFSQPADVGGNYEAFVKRQEQRIARAIGMPYEKFSGDIKGLNFSSIRAGNLEFQRQCKQFIYNVLAFQFCRPVARYWLNQAYLSGAIELPGYAKNPRQYWRIKWTVDSWGGIDPLKDLDAMKGRVRCGFSSRAHEVAENGLDVEALETEIAADNERADALGLVFDSDTRKTDVAGRNYLGEQQSKIQMKNVYRNSRQDNNHRRNPGNRQGDPGGAFLPESPMGRERQEGLFELANACKDRWL